MPNFQAQPDSASSISFYSDVLDGRPVACGAHGEQSQHKKCAILEKGAKKWSHYGDLKQRRSGHGSWVTPQRKLLLIGTESGQGRDTTELVVRDSVGDLSVGLKHKEKHIK